jgi:CDP-diglyceride synthetase
MNLDSLINLNFWFDFSPEPFLAWNFKFLELAFAVLILFGIIAKIVVIVKKKDFIAAQVAKKLAGPFLTMGVLGFLLLLMDFERAVFLSSRFWYAAWFLVFLSWLAIIVINLVKKLPARRRELDEAERLKKWLPKKK